LTLSAFFIAWWRKGHLHKRVGKRLFKKILCWNIVEESLQTNLLIYT
jgi:hypothetical protein